MRHFALPLAVVTTLAALGCSSSEPGPWVRPRRQAEPDGAVASVLAESRDLRVEYGGCATVRLGDGDELQCIYEPGATLRLWVMHEQEQQPAFAMEGDGAWSMGEPYVLPEELGQGYRLELTEAGLGAVTVTLPKRPVWRLALRAVDELSQEDKRALAEPRKRFVALEKKLAPESEVVSDLTVMDEIRELLWTMVREGQLWSAVKSGTAAAYHLTWRAGRPDLAQQLLEDLLEQIQRRVPEFERDYPFAAGQFSIYLGHVLRRRGQLAKAARQYRHGTRLVRRTDSPLHILDGMAPYALVLAELGYFEAAAYWSAEVRKLAIRHAKPYSLAQILVMVSKVSLRLREAHQIYDDPAPRLEEVRRIYGRDGPLANKFRQPFESILSRSELALLDGDPKRALAELRPLREKRLSADQRARVQETRLRSLILEDADPQSLLDALNLLKELATKAVGPELRWKASVLEARVYETLGQPEKALETYMKAEELLDQLLPQAALGLPGDFAAARHSEGTNHLISMLIRLGRLEEATCTIRRSRARIGQMSLLHRRFDSQLRESLSGPIDQYSAALNAYEALLDDSNRLATPEYEQARLLAAQRQRELEQQTFDILSKDSSYQPSLDCAKLSPRQRGELLLLLRPDDDALQIFIEDDRGITQFPTLAGYFKRERSDAKWQSDLLLHPLRERLSEAQRIRVLASGRSRQIPIHALPWSPTPHARDEDRIPLIQSIPVVYGLDLPIVADDPHQDTSAPRALIMTDSRAERSQDETNEVSSALRRRGWAISEVTSRSQTPSLLRRAMQTASHFHYSGHAYYADSSHDGAVRSGTQDDRLRRWPPYSGGAAAEPSYIPLGGEGRLTVSDILMMEHVPDSVVLMGCATGVIDERITHGGFSLATAFLGAGTRAVVASTHEIDGEEAAIVGRSLYADLDTRSDIESGRWMTRAIRSIREDQGRINLNVSYYRIYVP